MPFFFFFFLVSIILLVQSGYEHICFILGRGACVGPHQQAPNPFQRYHGTLDPAVSQLWTSPGLSHLDSLQYYRWLFCIVSACQSVRQQVVYLLLYV